MANQLDGKRVALLVTDGFELSELVEPKRVLEQEGAEAEILSLEKDSVMSWDEGDWGREFDVDVYIDDARVDDYDALVLPGGVMNPDRLRVDPRAVEFARRFFKSGKPVAAICHGPWLLVEADVLTNRRVTSYPSLKTDIANAGGHWVDEPIVLDGNLITSRRPDDLPEFCGSLVEAVSASGDSRHSATRIATEQP
jgi:protease I